MFRIIIHWMCFSYLFCSAKQTSCDMTQIRPQFMPCPILNSGHKRYHQMNRLGDVQGQLQSRWQKWRNNLCRFSASTAAILLGTDLRLSSDKLMLSLSPKPDAAAASPPATGEELIIRLPVTQGKTYMYTFMHMHNNLPSLYHTMGMGSSSFGSSSTSNTKTSTLLTQLNSTENYGRRCLTPLSPHRNYILS